LGNDKGITTVGFEELKHYYADTYEILTEVMPLVLAFNNLKYRADFMSMKRLRRDVTNLDEFLLRSKGDRIQYLDGTEFFDKLIVLDLDNKLRNAIAHNSYVYDSISQDIAYFSSGKTGEGDERHISLLEFAQKCWRLNQRIIDVAELVYQTAKFSYVLLRGQTVVGPEVFQSVETKRKRKDVKAQRNPRGTRK